ncbi:kinase-like domain-containing protein [Dichomitus squalens]|uniref:Kinase-like domain-containing protein n=1 Tax=Dichomitus squalens TaxID=114155 RepID=A0A4Q9MFF3_9APHY|nr:kinase-like domain-containing protein [Dichomitus squalens]
MLSCLGKARLVFHLLKAPANLRLFFSSSPSNVSTMTVSLPRRALSTMADSHNDIFNYTSGRWVYNDALRHKERRVAFDVDGLRRLAAESVNQGADDVVSLSKLAEGGFNRTFIVSLRNGQQIVARIPYPMTVPKYYAVASEVATIEYLRSSGFPAPQIYGYSPDSDNAAGTAYVLMELVQGSKLSEVWPSLENQELISVVRQLTRLESQMMSLSFPAGGSLYFTKDLEKVAPGLGVPLDDKRFCVGPDVSLPLWYGRRAKLDVDRGPYQSAEAVLIAAARKELAYLKQFGQPILPLRRERRPSYEYQPQSPSYHVENLERYLDVISSLVPRDPSLSRFCIRHPDLQQNNIMVSKSPGSDCKVVGLIDWQHTSILPMFLLAGIPQRLQNHGDSVSQAMTLPPLPENLDQLNGAERAREEYLYRRRLVHYHYVASTEECNQLHHAAFTDPFYALRGRLFQQARAPWEGETVDLKSALIQVTEKWNELTGGGVPCPIEFDAKDLRETAVLNKQLSEAERGFNILQGMCGVGEEGWVLAEDYENAVAFLKETKEEALAGAESVEEREEIMSHWPWDDMDETEYM